MRDRACCALRGDPVQVASRSAWQGFEQSGRNSPERDQVEYPGHGQVGAGSVAGCNFSCQLGGPFDPEHVGPRRPGLARRAWHQPQAVVRQPERSGSLEHDCGWGLRRHTSTYCRARTSGSVAHFYEPS